MKKLLILFLLFSAVAQAQNGQALFFELNQTTQAPSPASVSNLVGWYKSDAGVNQVGGGVDSWDNQATGMGSLQAVSSSTRPTLSTTSNGLFPAIRFNGTTSILQDITGMSSTWTVFIVNEPISVTAYGVLMSRGADAGFLWGWYNSTTVSVSGINFPVTAGFSAHTIVSSSNQSYYQNNALITSSIGVGNTAISPFRVGAYYNSTNYFNGNICEILVYQRALNAGELLAVYEYLKSRYNLP